MRPLADGIRGFPRLVRDVSKQLGKQAKFEVVGETTGVDRDILDGLEAPLNHLIRNALDHGLEMPEERRAAGKSPSGTIRLEARHRAGMLQIILADDGRGIDLDRLRAKVVEKGLTTAAIAGRLSEAELLDFLFLPGFSTKEKVTEISGRGVGLDVVQSMVQAVRGSVRVTSQLGKGTRFILQLPITVSVIRALLVEIAGEPFAFPLNRIDRILMLDRHDIVDLEGKPHVILDDQPLGLIEAAQVLELPTPAREDGRLPVVVASDRSHRFGVVIDRFLGERDLRVTPLDPRLGKVPNLNSSSVLDNGWPVLIIDVEDLIRSIDNLLGGRRVKKLTAEVAVHEESRGPKRILVVDDSITVRELERQLLENRGYTVDVAVDGVDGWNAVRTGPVRPGRQRHRHAPHGRHPARGPHQAGRPAEIHPRDHRVLQGPRGGPDPRPRRRRQLLPDQEQLPRPDVPGHGGRPDRGASRIAGRRRDSTESSSESRASPCETGGPSRSRWPGILACSTPPRPNVRTGTSRVAATESIGRTLMRTSAPRGFCGVRGATPGPGQGSEEDGAPDKAPRLTGPAILASENPVSRVSEHNFGCRTAVYDAPTPDFSGYATAARRTVRIRGGRSPSVHGMRW